MPDSQSIKQIAASCGVTIAEDGTITKAELAALCGVSAGAISHWIRDGKLTALNGEGRRARVRLADALTELGNTLDGGQQGGKRVAQLAAAVKGGHVSRLDEPAQSRAQADLPRLAVQDDDPSLERYQAARAEMAESRARRERLELARLEGTVIARDDVDAAIAGLFAVVVQKCDQAPQRIAEALHKEHGIPLRETTLAVRRIVHDLRRESATQIRMTMQRSDVLRQDRAAS